jgi:hypothetical protein
MAKFNTTATKAATGASPIVTEAAPAGVTHEGRPGYARDTKSELFLLAVANMVGESTFYEAAGDRDTRYAALIHEVAAADPTWTARFLHWLRTDGNMRSASLVGALEAAKAMVAAKVPGARQIVASVLQRADEPGEALAYWTSRYGRAIPKPVKRGIADRVAELYSEYALLKYDTASRGFRFADVIDLVHPAPARPWQGDLFEVALERRRNRAGEPRDSLPMLAANATLRAEAATNPAVLLDVDRLREAGMTWEDVLSLAGDRLDKADVWTAMIPAMGYMALLRNLRNFDQAGVSDTVAAQVAERLADPGQVAQSRQFPFRFYAAHNAVQSLRWGHALEKALAASLANVPVLPGRTLILIDQSPSMFPGGWWTYQATHRDIANADLAKLFGAALALRASDATLVGYGHGNYRVPFAPGEAVLRLMGKFRQEGGTDAYGAAHDHFDRHDRIVVVTDGENNGHRFGSYEQAGVPRTVPIYTWNIGGYKLAQDPGGPNRHVFAGLTDAAFRMVPLVEAGRSAGWDAIFGDGS